MAVGAARTTAPRALRAACRGPRARRARRLQRAAEHGAARRRRAVPGHERDRGGRAAGPPDGAFCLDMSSSTRRAADHPGRGARRADRARPGPIDADGPRHHRRGGRAGRRGRCRSAVPRAAAWPSPSACWPGRWRARTSTTSSRRPWRPRRRGAGPRTSATSSWPWTRWRLAYPGEAAARMDALVERLHALEPAEGFDDVLTPASAATAWPPSAGRAASRSSRPSSRRSRSPATDCGCPSWPSARAGSARADLDVQQHQAVAHRRREGLRRPGPPSPRSASRACGAG